MLKDRNPPAPVAPVVAGRVRYEAVEWGKSRGLKQNGGYLAAVDETTDEELWLLKVYDTVYKGRSGDKHDVFITSLELDETGSRLTVEDETGRRFVVDLADRRVVRA